MNVSEPWLWVSGAFFVLAAIAQIALIVLLIRLTGLVTTIKPSIENSVKKMETAAERVETAAKSIQTTVESVGGSTRHVAQSVESVFAAGAKKLEPIAGYIGIAMTALQVYREIRETFMSPSSAAEDEALEEDEAA